MILFQYIRLLYACYLLKYMFFRKLFLERRKRRILQKSAILRILGKMRKMAIFGDFWEKWPFLGVRGRTPQNRAPPYRPLFRATRCPKYPVMSAGGPGGGPWGAKNGPFLGVEKGPILDPKNPQKWGFLGVLRKWRFYVSYPY